MPYPMLDRSKLHIKPLSERPNKVRIERDHVSPSTAPRALSEQAGNVLDETVDRIREARRRQRPVMLTFGAHTIKNGLAPVLIRLIEQGWVNHLATNGAGIIHDWEFAFQGESSEDVRTNVEAGQFGIWQETGMYINLAIIVGAYEGLGYGESVGAMIERGGLDIPSKDELESIMRKGPGQDPERCAAASDLYGALDRFDIEPGFMRIDHPFKEYSVQAAAFRMGIPCTGHPMIGHDIIYTHPMNCGGAIGRTALRDFLAYAANVNRLNGGVYLSVGSAVMSPMIFEKSLSMSQNLHIQAGTHIDRHFIVVVDLAEATWDWDAGGEPPQDNPAYYLRYCKTFHRMGGTMRYVSADNREFLLTLCRRLDDVEV
jgi:hypothetical protein